MNHVLSLLALLLVANPACAPQPPAPAPAPAPADAHALKGPRDFWHGFPARRSDGRLNAVIEIPTGTNAKWEVDKEDGQLRWEVRDGKPRVVQYVGYPGNYGMIPQTLLPEELGGDGDPLDILVLGPAVQRGQVVAVRVIGMLRMLDDGEQDDKLLAVLADSPLGHVQNLAQLQAEFIGVTDIVETWFRNYKGPGRIETAGFATRAEAEAVLEAALGAYVDRS